MNFKTCSPWCYLPQDALDFLQNMPIVEFTNNQIIFNPSDNSSEVYIILKGSVYVKYQTVNYFYLSDQKSDQILFIKLVFTLVQDLYFKIIKSVYLTNLD